MPLSRRTESEDIGPVGVDIDIDCGADCCCCPGNIIVSSEIGQAAWILESRVSEMRESGTIKMEE